MGNRASTEADAEPEDLESQPLVRDRQSGTQVRKYRVPEVRALDRFEQADLGLNANTYEASIDKYDYLLIFPLTERPQSGPDAKRGPRSSDNIFITWDEIARLWMQAIPGTDDQKHAGIETLMKYWQKRMGQLPTSAQQIHQSVWLTIAREAIIDQLTKKSGLQLKMSANAHFIFCRIRAPIKLLELQADKEHYRLQLRGEIDPGSEEFWNKTINERAVELDEERRLYSKDEANIILEKLYRAGKIAATDIAVDPTKEVQALWSRRVHALERIADRVPIFNKFIAYVPFRSEPHFRYLYQTHPSVRGKTLFRAKDRLYLTKAIIHRFFDCDVLADTSRQRTPILVSFMALHDANRGERVTIDILERRWVTFWRATAREVGAPTVTHPAYEDEVELSWYVRPWAQPLSDIRDYFGEKLALYFAWFGYYIYFLIFPAILGVGMEVLIYLRGEVDISDKPDWYLYAFVVLTIIWATVYQRMWEIESKVISVKWGTRGFESEEKERPQFRSDLTIRSVVHNRKTTYYPESKRLMSNFFSYFILMLVILSVLSLSAGLFYMEKIILELFADFTWWSWSVSVALAIVIRLGTIVSKPIIRGLTNNENHRTETEYEDSMIAKTLLFEMFNNYAPVVFTAFGKDLVFHTCEFSCMFDLRKLLYCIILVRIVMNLWDIISPAIRSYIREYMESADGTGGEAAHLHDDPDDNQAFVTEIYKPSYEGTFNDYSYAVFQFGYVTLFTVAFPMQAIIALVENMLKLRTDAFRICAITRRPHVALAEDVGKWSLIMDSLSILGIVTAVGIICFTSKNLEAYSTLQKWLIFLFGEQALMGLKFVIQSFIAAEPKWLLQIIARQQYVEDKWVKGYEDDEDLELVISKGNLEDTVDVDGLNLFDLRKESRITEEEYAQMEALESKRRELLRELRTAKDKLLEIYKTEIFNESTGIGESKHGLPLGRLSVKVIEIQNFQGPDYSSMGENPSVKIRVVIKGHRQTGPPAGPAVGPLSDTSNFRLTNGNASINKALGPFAPIRTQDADVVFEVLDMSPSSNQSSVASASIKLRELQDQANHDIVLHLRARQPIGAKDATDPRLFVSVKFEYSKVVPLRNRIFFLQDKLRTAERDLAGLKSGRTSK